MRVTEQEEGTLFIRPEMTDYIRTLMRSTAPGDVLTALQDVLRQRGYATARVRLGSQSPCEENASSVTAPDGRCWTFALPDVEETLIVEIRTHPEDKPMPAELQPYIELAQDTLQRILLERQHRARLGLVVERLGASVDEPHVLTSLLEEILDIYDMHDAYVLRYQEESSDFRVEAIAHRSEDIPPAQPGHIFDLNMCSAHALVLETGTPQWFIRGGEPDLNLWEWGVFYSPQSTRALLIPFWLNTQEMGILGVGGDKMGLLEEDLLFLLRYSTLAIERAHAFQEALQHRRETELILNRTLAGILLLDSHFRVQRANEAAARFWHTHPSLLMGKSADELFGPSFLLPQGPLHRTQEGTCTVESVEWTLEVGEEERTLLLSITPWTGNGEEAGYVISFLDMTEHKRLERLKEQMLANVTHELRTPIAVIRGYAELLLSQLPPDAPPLWPEALHIIEQRANDLLDMVVMYLDLAQLEANGHTLHRELVSVPTVVEELVTQLMGRIRHPLDVAVDIAPEARQVYADPHLFSQIVRHLLDNAMKFTAAGGHVWLRVWEEDGDFHMEVGDTGMGIPAQEVNHIFERFYRASNVEYGIPGSGLGLTLVEEAVRAHGGTIEVNSEEGKGTVIHLTLPQAVPETRND